MASKPVDRAQAPPGASGFLHSALLMFGGVAGAQLITFLVMPVVTRLFSPSALGVQAVFISAAGTLTVLATLRLDLAIVLPKEDRVAARIWWLGFYQGLAAALLIGATALFAGGWIHDLFTPDVSSASWVWLLAPMLVASVVTQMGTGLATRQGRFELVVVSNMATALVFAAAAVSIGYLSPGDEGVVVSRLLGQTAGCVSLISVVLVLSRPGASWRMSPSRVREVWRDQRQFLVFNTPYSVVGGLARDFPLYVFAAGGGAALAAAYALARTVMLAPTTLISGALSSVFYREAAEHLGTPRLKELALALSRWGLLLPIPAFAFVAVWGDELFVLVFGAEWRTAGDFARILAVPLWLALQTGWPERLFEAARRQGVSFAIQMGFDALHAVVVVGVYFGSGSALWAVGAYAVTYSAYHVSYLVAVFGIAGFGHAELARVGAVAVLGFAGGAGVLGLGRGLLPLDTGVNFVVAAMVALLATGILVRVIAMSGAGSVIVSGSHHVDSEGIDD